MTLPEKKAPTTFTDPVRRAQKERLVSEMNDFFTELAREEMHWPAVPDDLIIDALADALVLYSNERQGTVTLQLVIDQLQSRLTQLLKG